MYLQPPEGFSLEPIKGFMKISIMIQFIIGVAVFLVALFFLLKIVFNIWRRGYKSTKDFYIAIASFIIAILLIGNGWIRVLDVQNRVITKPLKEILHQYKE